MDDTRRAHDQILGAGIDIPRRRRPGSPMESTPHDAPGAHGEALVRQPVTAEILKRADLPELTPVFGSAQPPHGLSGALRRYAYRIPDHRPRHWALLFFADRVDVGESAIADLVRRRPVAVAGGLALVAGAVAAIWIGVRRSGRARLVVG
jgi:hypothetical protein